MIRFLRSLVWSRQTRDKKLGYVADYCGICRDLKKFTIHEQRLAGHLFYIPVQNGVVTGATQTCSDCNTEWTVNPNQFAAIARSDKDPWEMLIAQTSPGLAERYKDQLAQDQKLKSGEGLDSAARLAQLREVFAMVERKFHSGQDHAGLRILAQAMKPLQPTDEEIAECLRPYQHSRSRMGMQLSVHEAIITIYPERKVKKAGHYEY